MARPRKSTEEKIKRIYLCYHNFDIDHSKLVLAFRTEESLSQHIIDNKICENSIIYIGKQRPKNEYDSQNGSHIRRTMNSFYEYIRMICNDMDTEKGGFLSGI